MCWAFPYDEVIDGRLQGLWQAGHRRRRRARGAASTPRRSSTRPTSTRRESCLPRRAWPKAPSSSVTMETGYEDVKAAVQLFQQNLAQIGITLRHPGGRPEHLHRHHVRRRWPAEERPNMMPWFWWPDYNDAYNHLYPQIACDQRGQPGRTAATTATSGWRSSSMPSGMSRPGQVPGGAERDPADHLPGRPAGHLLHAAPVDDGAAQGHRGLRLQPDQYRDLQLLCDVTEGIRVAQGSHIPILLRLVCARC